MSPVQRLRARLTDSSRPGSLAARARAGRWQLFSERFPDIAEMRVLDLGGTPESWIASGFRPQEVVLLNLDPMTAEERWLRPVQGDACSPPDELRGERFDLVYCNSVIDQVGGHAQRTALAETVRAHAPHHWVQTAYRYFPLDAYFLFPGFASLPLRLRAEVNERWRLSQRHSEDPRRSLDGVLGVELLTATHMRHYFPESEVLRERFLGFTKSLIAVA